MFKMLRTCIDAYTTQAVSFVISNVDTHGSSDEYYLVIELLLKETGSDLEKFVQQELTDYLNELFIHCFGDLKVPPQVDDAFTIGVDTCLWKGEEVDLKTHFPELEFKLNELVNLNYWIQKLKKSDNSWMSYFAFTQAGFTDKLPLTDWLANWSQLEAYNYYKGNVIINFQTNSAKITWTHNNQSVYRTQELGSANYINHLSMKITPGSNITKNEYLLVWKGVVYAASSIGIYGVCVRENSCTRTALVDWSLAYEGNRKASAQVIYRISWAEFLQKYDRADNKIEDLDLILSLAELNNSPEILIFEKGAFESVHQIYKIKHPINCDYKPTPLELRPLGYFSSLVRALESDSLFAVTAICAELLETEAEYIAHQKLYFARA
jgi:hypothetical protein